MVHHSLAPLAVSTQSTLVLSQELISGAWVSVPNLHTSISGCCFWGQWCIWSVRLSLCFALLSPAAALFSTTLMSLYLSWSPHQLGDFPGCGFISSLTDLSQQGWSYPDSFFSLFSFYSTHLGGEFLALLGDLRSASFQYMLCVNHSTCRFFSDVYVGEGEHHVLLFHHLDPSPPVISDL